MTPHDRLTLAFDTSTPHCAVAVVRGETVLATVEEPMLKGQAERLMPLIQDTLNKAGVTMQDLDCIGAGIGPGNFTGTRISVAAARGLALALRIPAEGVSAIEAYADGALDRVTCLPAPRGAVILGRGGDTCLLDRDAPVPAPWRAPVTGPAAADIAARADQPEVPAPPIAVSIARIAAARAAPGRPRPAPMYLRPADAAPARDAPPRIL